MLATARPKPIRSARKRQPIVREDGDHVEESAGARHRPHEAGEADEHEADLAGEQAHLGDEGRKRGGRRGRGGGPKPARLGMRKNASAAASAPATA